MSHILNRSGAETDLFRNLAQRGIHRFSSVDDLFVFKRNYLKEIEDLRERTAAEVKEEIEAQSLEVASLRIEYEQQKAEQKELIISKITRLNTRLSQLSQNIVTKIKGYFLKKRLSHLESVDEVL